MYLSPDVVPKEKWNEFGIKEGGRLEPLFKAMIDKIIALEDKVKKLEKEIEILKNPTSVFK